MTTKRELHIDAEFLKPFVESTIATLSVQCHLEVAPSHPYFKGSQPQTSFELAGVINIAAPTFSGSITICFPEKVFLKMMSNMLGEEFTSISEDLQSGAAELLNIIYGGAKVILNKKGHAIQKALPTVIRGSALTTSHTKGNPVVVLPFKTSVGDFQMEIWSEKGFAA